MYEVLQSKLEAHGEVIVVMDSGETVELHLGNTEFDEPEPGVFYVRGLGEAGEERYYDGGSIESVRLHYEV
ncbi:MAG: hypothetical protein ABEI31_01310 [Halodesulfurarchaeum sp.]